MIELKDLGLIVNETRNNLATLNSEDISLSAEFKDVFANSIGKTGNTIVYKEKTAEITTVSGQKIYAPNQWFILASIAVPLAKEVMIYREFTERMIDRRIDDIKSVDSTEIKEKKDVYQIMRAGEDKASLISNLQNKLEAIFVEELVKDGYSESIAKNNTSLLIRFLKDSKWWLGGKGIERTNDYYVSPVLGVLNLVNASQTYVATMTYLYANDKTLNDKLSCIVEADNEDPEERNKRLFKYWMSSQVKPVGDSDAGSPYSEDSISTYISFIKSTKLSDDRSLFATVDSQEIMAILEQLEKSDSASSRQRSSVRKYYEFVQETVLDNIAEDIFKHNLYGIHIKNKNDALTDNNSHICIGWSALGDLSDIKTKEELEKVFDDTYDVDNARSRGQQVGQVWRFYNDLKVGDYIIFADSDMFHIGRVESDYYYDENERPEQDPDYKNNRKVKWLKKGISRSTISLEFHRALMTAMSIFTINDYKSAVVDLIKDVYVKDDNEVMGEEYMELVYNTSLDSDYDRNRIIFGAPGTGKSFTLNEQAKDLIDATDGKVERVTFHPDYTYSQFVGAYKPTMNGTDIRYEFVPGPFMRVYVDALKSGRTDNPQPFLLIVEEINRAKVAGVFGDIFQLLDRDDDGVSVYEIQASEDVKKYLAEKLGGQASDYTNIRIPNNMFIWATMNSADQGVFPMDTAFKRRWSFEYLGIDAGEDNLPSGGKFTIAGTEIEWNKLRKGINSKMTSPDFHINEDKLMGPFFLSGKLLKSDDDGNIINPQKFIDVFKSKVLMYLYEDAVKQRKHDFFHNCDTSKYSSVCEAFDTYGIEIFGNNFMSDYYNK